MARKPVEDMITELRTWLRDYERGPGDYPTTIYRILASLPGGDALEEQGVETIGSVWGWREKDQIQRMLSAIEGPRDVQDLIRGLAEEEEEEEDSKNIFWRDIPPSATVEQVRQTYVVTLSDGSKAVAYWMGNDATEAQRALDKMAARRSKPRRAPKRRR